MTAHDNTLPLSKPFTLVRHLTALPVVLQCAAVILHDRGGHGLLYLRDQRDRFHRITVRGDEARGAIAQVGSNWAFVTGDRALQEILGLGSVRASVHPCLIATVSPQHEVGREQTLAELAAGLLFRGQAT